MSKTKVFLTSFLLFGCGLIIGFFSGRTTFFQTIQIETQPMEKLPRKVPDASLFSRPHGAHALGTADKSKTLPNKAQSDFEKGMVTEKVRTWIAELTTEAERLENRVKELEDQILFEQGKPIEFPDKLDPVYLQEALLENFNKAFAEADVPSEASMIDCDEFPCIVCGRMPAQHGENFDINAELEDLKRVSQTKAMDVYKNAGRLGTVNTSKDKQENDATVHHTVFCQSFFPKPGDEQKEQLIEKRTHFRMEQLRAGM